MFELYPSLALGEIRLSLGTKRKRGKSRLEFRSVSCCERSRQSAANNLTPNEREVWTSISSVKTARLVLNRTPRSGAVDRTVDLVSGALASWAWGAPSQLSLETTGRFPAPQPNPPEQHPANVRLNARRDGLNGVRYPLRLPRTPACGRAKGLNSHKGMATNQACHSTVSY